MSELYSMNHILIVEDDHTFAKIVSNYLQRHDYQTTIASDLATTYDLIQSQTFDLMLLDYNLPDGKGIDCLNYLNKHQLTLPVLIMTSFLDIKTAVEAIKKGAYDYITKPINQEELLMVMTEMLSAKNSDKAQTLAAKNTKPSIATDSEFVKGISDKAIEIQQHISLVAPTDMSVLITGESGTGKENIARSLHQLSHRSEQPFIAIDCGALSNDLAASELFGHVKGAFTGATSDKKGQFELANGGTIFLDEVGNLSYENQVKLLRVIQEKEVLRVGDYTPIKIDVRIITATNEDFKQAIQKGTFREDLYHRINEFKIKVPALRDRKEDLMQFVDFFIKKSNIQLNKDVKGINEEVENIFLAYSWPGNIRELQNTIKRAVLLCQTMLITVNELPDDMEIVVKPAPAQDNWLAPASHATTSANEEDILATTDIKSMNEQLEKELIIKTLIQTQYNKSKTARLLKIDRTTLYNKLNKYGILDD